MPRDDYRKARLTDSSRGRNYAEEMQKEAAYDAAVDHFLAESPLRQMQRYPGKGPRCACGNMRKRTHKVCKACRRKQ